MTITTTTLTRAAGVSAVVGGALFIAVQFNHPHLDPAFARTTEYAVREAMKIAFGILSLIGITGVYLRQVKQAALVGLVGYVLLAAALFALTCVEVMGLVAVPVLAHSDPKYAADVLAVANNGTALGDVGLFTALNTGVGLALVSGGLLFGIAVFRARVISRWPGALLAVAFVATLAIHVLPQVNDRLFALPIGVAIAWLGIALLLDQRKAGHGAARDADARLDTADVR